jgi:Fe-Mn family superoxide dismutase
MPFTLLPLPFTPDALEPHMSAETVRLHHGKHHQAYVDKTNALALEQGQSKRSLLDLIGGDIEGPLLNNAGQLWNHNFFWQCLSARQQQPEGRLADLVTGAFGTIAALEKALVDQAQAHFGSGWVWLVLDQGALKITALHDGDTPASLENMAPLLTIDVWEHAYYVDYRNARAKYVTALLEHHINWAFVAENLDGRGLSRADQS